ncbi:MAG: protein-L-isoaspartate(D-aspartate) O-methyltransferase [Sphingomicrobium sp.]
MTNSAPINLAAERAAMVERQLRQRGIIDPAILEAFLAVPREMFVGAEYAQFAYGDHPLPIEAGQTISQPYIVALMIQAAGIGPGDRVLEVGAGSGYAAAVIGRIAGHVTAIERASELVAVARGRIERLRFANIEIVEGDGTLGFADKAPFNSILVAASGTHVPTALAEQLAPGGSIVMPLGGPGGVQQLVKVTKSPDGSLEHEGLGAVRFVPLIGAEGWSDLGQSR